MIETLHGNSNRLLQPAKGAIMKRNAAITKFKPLSQKVLRRLAEDRIIESPLTDSNQQFLSALCRIWTDEWYVAPDE